MTTEEIKQKIQGRYPDTYKGEHLEDVVSKIESMDADLREKVEKFLETGEVEDMEVEGYTAEKLISDWGMLELAAYLTLDWLRREPEEAKRALEHGFDFIK